MVTILLAYSVRRRGEVEAGKVADAGAVERVAVPPGIEANEVERNGGEDVLQVSAAPAECIHGLIVQGTNEGLDAAPAPEVPASAARRP